MFGNNNRIYGYIYNNYENPEETGKELDMLLLYVNVRDIFFDVENQSKRKVLQFIIEHVLKSGDILIVRNIKSFGNNQAFTINIMNDLFLRGINLYFIENDSINRVMEIQEKINKAKQELILQINEEKRQATINGIDNMPIDNNGKKYSFKTGNYIGRPLIEFPDNFEEIYIKYKNKEILAKDAIEELGLKKASFYNLIKRYENK